MRNSENFVLPTTHTCRAEWICYKNSQISSNSLLTLSTIRNTIIISMSLLCLKKKITSVYNGGFLGRKLVHSEANSFFSWS